MLKRVFIVISMALTSCFASVVPSMAVKNANENLKASRVFSGRVEKTGFWQSLRSDYKYRLYDKDQCIACLDFNEKVRSPEVLKAFLGKNVIVKGSPQYINKEPYLVITVDDVSEQ
jgi:hypothetical protein